MGSTVTWMQFMIYTRKTSDKDKAIKIDFGTIWNRFDKTQLCLKSRHLYEYEWKDVIGALTFSRCVLSSHKMVQWEHLSCKIKHNTTIEWHQ